MMPIIDDIPVRFGPVLSFILTIAALFLLNPTNVSAQTISVVDDSPRTDATAAPETRSDPRIVGADFQTILDDATSGKSELTVVNMWATWCAPCLEEFPDFVQLAQRYDSSKVRVLFVSVDFDEELAEVGRFLDSQEWEQVTYLKKQKDNEFVSGFGDSWTGAVPATFVFDSEGDLLWFVEGKTTFSVLNSVIESNVK